MRLELEMPTSLPSLPNIREHWSWRHSRGKKLKGDVWLMLRSWRNFTRIAASTRELGATITLTRIARRPYDSDNLSAAFKPIRDGIAAALRMNDGDRRLDWRYENESGEPDRVRVTIQTPEASTQ